MKPIRIARDRWNFELVGTGELIAPVGGNILDVENPAQGTLFRHFDKENCDRRFGLMADLGLNCLRQAIGVNEVFDSKIGLKKQGLKNWDVFIGLAERHGIYLMPVGGYIGGNDWFDVGLLADSGRQLGLDCAFWEAFVGHYAGHPAIWAWDLRNELLFWPRPHFSAPGGAEEKRIEEMLKDGWMKWLEVKYGSVATMNRIYGTKRSSFAEVSGSIAFIEKPFDLNAYDFRCYLNERGYRWCQRQCEVIRAVSPTHMVINGNHCCFAPDMDLWLANGFHNRALHELFDFVTFHPYPAWQCASGGRGDPLDGGDPLNYWLHACIGMARMEHYGKPVVLQEFGWYGEGSSRFLEDLPYRSEKEHADYTRTLTDALIPHVNGFLNWPTFDMPTAGDISKHGGIFTSEGRRKDLARVFADLAVRLMGKPRTRARGTAVLTVSLMGLYTSRPYQDRLWDEVHATISSGKVPDFRFI